MGLAGFRRCFCLPSSPEDGERTFVVDATWQHCAFCSMPAMLSTALQQTFSDGGLARNTCGASGSMLTCHTLALVVLVCQCRCGPIVGSLCPKAPLWLGSRLVL